MKTPFASKLLIAAISLLSAAVCRSDEPAAGDKPPASPMLGKEAGQVRDDNGMKLKLVWCPPGKFTMGSPEGESERHNDENQVNVTLTRGFWLGKYEVTQQEYERIMGKNPSWFSAKGDGKQKVADQDASRFPVENVSWNAATEFCRKLTDMEREARRMPMDWEYTLPTEAQWEYACRAETTTPFSFGARLNGKDANCRGAYPDRTTVTMHALNRTTKVGSYKANKWGLYDMHGNVREWCRDWYADKLLGGTDPEVTSAGSSQVSRGGGFGSILVRTLSAGSCRSASRCKEYLSDRGYDRGFRVALTPSSRQVRPAEPGTRR